jgi:hypothetical protein
VNKTGFAIWYVYLSDAKAMSWGPDRLKPEQVINNGESVKLNLPYPLKLANVYNIRLRDVDGDDYVKLNVRVRANSKIEFTINDISAERFYERVNELIKSAN